MSQDFYVDVVLKTEASADAIATLLAHGAELGIGYLGAHESSQRGYMTPEQAKKIIVEGLLCARKDQQDFSKIAHLAIKANETYASVIFYEREGNLALSLRPASTYWRETADDENSVDLSRYKQLLVDWCKDFEIITTEEIDSWDEMCS